MIKIFNYFFQALFIYLFFIIGKLIGLNLSRRFFAIVFSTLGPRFKSNSIIEKNLLNFKEDITYKEKKDIVTNMWENYGKTFIEYIFLNILRKNNSHISISGENILNEIIKKNKPVIFVSGHFANFELMSMEITKKNIKLATIYRPLNNYFLNPFMEYLRKKYVCQNQIKKGINGVRDAINYLKKDYSVALMIDQRVSEGEKVEFFEKPALTTTLPAQLALKFNLSIVPVFIERTSENNFLIKFFEELSPDDFNNKISFTKKLNEVLEELIKKNPNQWIWTHDRWK